MLRLLIGPACAALLVVPLVGSEPETTLEGDPAGNPDRTPVDTLIEQLGHRSFQVREAAGAELQARGEEALPALREARRTGSPEIRRRAEVLAHAIEQEVLLSPKRITLHLDNRPYQEAVDAIMEQTGYQIQLSGSPEENVTIHLDNASYWEAIDDLCLKGGMWYASEEYDGMIRLYPQDTYSPYVHRVGPFRVVANNIYTNRTVTLTNLPRNGQQHNEPEYMGFSFDVHSEPKVPLLKLGTPVLIEAIDQEGNSLIPPDDHEDYYGYYYDNSVYRSNQQQASVSLTRRSRDSVRIKVIRGKIPLTLLAEQRPEIVVEKLDEVEKGKYVGPGSELIIDDLELNNGTLTATLQINRRGEINPDDYAWVNNIYQRLIAEDADGNRYVSQIQNYINMSPQSLHATFSFFPPGGKELGPPVRMMLVRWVPMEHEIEFEFRDLPLP